MKDPVESSEERDSIPTDSFQSKGEGMKEVLTLCTYLMHISIYKQILIRGHSCWIKIHFIQRILGAVQPSVTQLLVSLSHFFPPPVSISYSL